MRVKMLGRTHSTIGVIMGIKIISALVVISCLVSCVSRTFFPSRSEEIKVAKEKGLPARSIEEERRFFFAQEEQQKKRLVALLKKRAEGEYRDSNYRFGPADEIELNVFDVPELNVTSKVRQSGFLTLPLIGAVKAVGLTEQELVDELSDRLKTYVRNPQVSLFVTSYGSQNVAVMGAVRAPGTYPLKKGSNSMLELLAQAGGVSDKAGNFINFIPAELSGIKASSAAESRAQLALAADNGINVRATGIEIYLDQILGTSGGIPLEIPVRGGDMIIVPEAGKIMVEGEVLKGGSVELGQQFTLLGALAAAGGITYGANVEEVEVIREAGLDRKARLVMDIRKIGTGEERDPRLRNGDIVRVPSHSGRRLTQDTFDSISRIINFGVGGTVNVLP